MIHIRLIRPCRREFERDVYTPGVISLSRILWGSLGGGLLLFLIGLLSRTLHISVLFPPLAATCFISATCVYLRVARPKSVIVGHFVSMIAGLLAVVVGDALLTGSDMLVPVKLGLAVLLAAFFMQVLDADHPPAAATAAIPAILPLPDDVSTWLLPLHMAWGAVIAVIFAIAWNRVWFEYPSKEPGMTSSWLHLNLSRPDTVGLLLCVCAFALMCFRRLSATVYDVGLAVMLAGVLVMALHHFFTARVLTKGGETTIEVTSGNEATACNTEMKTL